MKTIRWRFAVTGGVLIAMMAACDSSTDATYRGERLATISGTLVSESSAPQGAQAGLLWFVDRSVEGTTPDGGILDQALLGDLVPVEAGFPARFDLAVYAAAPDEALLGLVPGVGLETDPTGAITPLLSDHSWEDALLSVAPREQWGAVAFAYITVVSSEARGQVIAGLHDTRVLGVSERFLVAYVARELQPREAPIPGLGFPLSVGYHLLEVTWHAPDGTETDAALVYACDDAGNYGDDGGACGYPSIAEVSLDTAITINLDAHEMRGNPIFQDFTDKTLF